MNARRILGPVLIVLSLLVAACGTPSTSSTTSTDVPSGATTQGAVATAAAPAQGNTPVPVSGEKIQMRMAWWGSQSRHDRTIKVIELFRQENPNVEITWEFSAFTDYFTKLTTQAAGGNLPCLIQQDYQYIGEWVGRNQLLALDDFIANKTIDATDIDEAYLAGGRLNGKTYAISLGTNTQSLLLDTALFEKAGIAIPQPNWTWTQFEELLTQLKAKLNIYGMSTQLDDNQVFKLWVKQHGKTLYSDDGSMLGYDDDKIYVDYFTMLKRLMEKGLIPTREFEVSQGSVTIEDNIFVKQEAAIGYMHSNQIVAVSSANGGRALAALPYPSLEIPNAGVGNYLKPSQFFSITAKCDHPEVAAKLINFFTNSIPANDILAAERGVPISTKVREALQPKVEAAQQEAFKLVATVGENPGRLDPPDPPGSAQVINDVYTPLMDQVLYGKLSPEDAAKQFREQANAILAKNKK